MDKTSFLGIQTVENILKTYGNDILRLSYSYMKNISDSEDVLQDTLIKYMNTMPVFVSTSHQKAWLFRVAINICKNKLKSSWFKTEQLSEDYTMLTDFNDNENMIIGAINSLTVKYREVLFLFYYEGYSTMEIAKILNKKESTVRSLLLRARKKLKTILKEAYDFYE